jgi:hypothetical protein
LNDRLFLKFTESRLQKFERVVSGRLRERDELEGRPGAGKRECGVDVLREFKRPDLHSAGKLDEIGNRSLRVKPLGDVELWIEPQDLGIGRADQCRAEGGVFGAFNVAEFEVRDFEVAGFEVVPHGANSLEREHQRCQILTRRKCPRFEERVLS